MSQRILVYDSTCPMCVGAVRWVVRLRLLGEDVLRPVEDLDEQELGRLLASGFRNEIVALDVGSGEERRGVRGILWVLRGSWLGPLARLLDVAPLRPLLRLGYRLVAYNRRILAPAPRTPIACACDPDTHLGYRLGFVATLVAFAVSCVAPLGALAARRADLPPLQGAALLVLILASGWALPGLAALLLHRGMRLVYLGHLAVTAAIGALPIALAAVVLVVARPGAGAFVVTAGLASGIGLLAMVRSRQRRLAAQGLGPRWLAAWSVCVVGVPAVLAAVLDSARDLLGAGG